jgi:putative ATPase
LRRLIEGHAGAAGPLSAIIWGPPGTGKTTLAHLVANAAGRRFVELSAVTAGVKDVRAVMEAAARERDMYDRQTVLFLDEIHRFTKAQQDALLSGVENRLVVLVAATTENPSFSVIAPLLSRSMLITLEPLSDDELDDVLAAALTEQRGLAGVFNLEPEARQHVIRMAGGDARRALTSLEAAAGVALDAEPAGRVSDQQIPIALSQVEQAVAHAAVRYDRAGDQHYDVASALIKSMRGSDVDASLHYLARMLEAGEDPRFIARRIVIAASEDVGMADPSALQTAVAAMHAVAQIGMPEARIILAQAVVHNAIAPKSNSSYLGINAAIADIRAGRGGSVPVHLRGSGYAGATRLGHGEGYRYAHDDPAGVVAQQYLPDDLLVDADYYRPTDRGFEQTLSARWTRLKERIRGT